MNKNIFSILFFLIMPVSVLALTVPGPDADIDKLSYIFYLYYDNGQIFADRDYEIKYDVVSEIFSPESPSPENAYKAEIINLKSEISKTFSFDPKNNNPTFNKGKIQVKGPYVADGMRVQFYDTQSKPILSIFINAASICNDDGACNAAAGENDKTCPNDCKKPRQTVEPAVLIDDGGFLGSVDTLTLAVYGASGLGVIVLGWFGWRWWKKKKEESFLPPTPPPANPTPTGPQNPPSLLP